MEANLSRYAEEPLPLQLLMEAFSDYKRPHDKINELVKKGTLTMIKKGFYVPGPASGVQGPATFLIANHLWGPSYISLESALSHWGMIPEKVFEISSITVKATKTYQTPAGRFSFLHTPLPYYSFGIQTVFLSSRQSVMIASPEKAICDKIVMTSGIRLRSTKQVREFLFEDMRVDEKAIEQLDSKTITAWITDAPKKDSLHMLVKMIKE